MQKNLTDMEVCILDILLALEDIGYFTRYYLLERM